MSASIDQDLEKLDELLATLAASPEREVRLVEEHTQFARAYLLGSMPGEYQANLKMARHAAAQVGETKTRQQAEETLDNLISAAQNP